MKIKHKFLDPNIPRKNDYLDSHFKKQAVDNKPPIFSVLEFDLTGLCNRKCIFCPRSNPKVFPSIDRQMPIELYEKIINDVGSVNFEGSVIYSGFGEPLLYKKLEEAIRITRKNCSVARIEIITNGDLLTSEKLSGLFAAGLDTICISMYDGPSQLKHFNKLKRSAGLRDEQMVLRKRWLSPEEHFGISLCNRGGILEMKELGIAALKKPLKKACYYPFCQTLVDYDGRVLLCTHDWTRSIIAGNVNDDSILDIWDNDTLRNIKARLAKKDREFSPCNVCDIEGSHTGRKYFNKWVRCYDRTKKAD